MADADAGESVAVRLDALRHPPGHAPEHADTGLAPDDTDVDADAAADSDDVRMGAALERVGYGRFQRRLLLPVTGLTLLADAMELMLLPFLTLGVGCEWGRSADGSSGSGADGSASGSVGDVESSLLSTSVFAGMLVGALLSGLLSDRWGRRPAVMCLTACTGLFGLASALAPGFYSLLLCRALVGVGVGGSPAALALFTEFLPTHQRGRHLVHYMCYFSGGAVLEVVLAWLVLNRWGWRCLLFLSSLPALALVLLVWLYLPESASWLLAQGRGREAAAVLQRAFHSNHPDMSHHHACPMHTERDEIEGQEQGEEEEEEEEGSGPRAGAHAEELIPCRCTAHGRAAAPSLLRGSPGGNDVGSSVNGGRHSGVLSSSADTPAMTTAASLTAAPRSSPRSSSVRIRRRVAGFLDPISLVFSPSLRRMSVHLCVLFFLMAFVYYGLVLMSLSFVQDREQHQSRQCTLRDDQYLQLLAANIAEFPGLFICFLLLDRVGRRLTITYMFLATAACTLCIPALWAIAERGCAATTTAAATAAAATSATSPDGTGTETAGADGSLVAHCPLGPLLDWAQSILLFGARGFSLAFNQALWIYTSELYPSQVRSSGLGLTTVFARVGGAVSPFIGQWLYWRSRNLAVASCVAAAVVAAALAARMPNDTKGAELQVRIRTRAAAGAAAGSTTSASPSPSPPSRRGKNGYASVSNGAYAEGAEAETAEPDQRGATQTTSDVHRSPVGQLGDHSSVSGPAFAPAPVPLHPASSPRSQHGDAAGTAAMRASSSSSSSTAAPGRLLLLGAESQPSSEEEAAPDPSLAALNLDVLRDDADDTADDETDASQRS